jgi:hypothetical protein
MLITCLRQLLWVTPRPDRVIVISKLDGQLTAVMKESQCSLYGDSHDSQCNPYLLTAVCLPQHHAHRISVLIMETDMSRKTLDIKNDALMRRHLSSCMPGPEYDAS